MDDLVYLIDGKRFIGTQSQAEEYARRVGKSIQSATKGQLLQQGIEYDDLPIIEQLRQ